jgi:hypothetical protein
VTELHDERVDAVVFRADLQPRVHHLQASRHSFALSLEVSIGHQVGFSWDVLSLSPNIYACYSAVRCFSSSVAKNYVVRTAWVAVWASPPIHHLIEVSVGEWITNSCFSLSYVAVVSKPLYAHHYT